MFQEASNGWFLFCLKFVSRHKKGTIIVYVARSVTIALAELWHHPISPHETLTTVCPTTMHRTTQRNKLDISSISRDVFQIFLRPIYGLTQHFSCSRCLYRFSIECLSILLQIIAGYLLDATIFLTTFFVFLSIFFFSKYARLFSIQGEKTPGSYFDS